MSNALPHLDLVRRSIAEELAVDPAAIAEGSTLFTDLGLDSLDVLNVAFRIEQALARKLPVQLWLSELGQEGDALERFSVADLCRRLETA